MPTAGEQIGPYTLMKPIGVGTYGEVWSAEKRTAYATTEFALKIPLLNGQGLHAFKQEAQVWSNIEPHSNVLPLIEAEVYGSYPVLVMPFVRDGALRKLLQDNLQQPAPMPSADAAVAMTLGILAGLEHLHTQNPVVLHRDLKPENVLLYGDRPCIADFGLARSLMGSRHASNAGHGTFFYLAPELRNRIGQGGTVDYTAASDLYAVGVMLCEMMTGRRPFPMLTDQIKPLLEKRWLPIVQKALAEKPEDRYRSAREFRNALEAVTKTRPSPQEPMSGFTRRLLFMGVVGSVVAAGGWEIWQHAPLPSHNHTNPPPAPQPLPELFVGSLSGHMGGVNAVAYSADGKYLVTGSDGGAAQTWDAATGKELQTLHEHGDWVNAVCYSPDGKYIVTGSKDKTAKIWDVATGQALQTLAEHTGWIGSVCYSPDGLYIVTGSGDHTAKVWDASTGQSLRALEGHTSYVTSVCYSPDGKYIVTGSGDHTARIWDAAAGSELRTLSGHTDWVTSVCYSPEGKYLVTGSRDNTAKIWDATTGTELRTLSGHTAPVTSVCYSPDGKYIVTGSKDTKAKVWTAATGTELCTLSEHTDSVTSVCYSPNGRYIATGSLDKTATVSKVQW